MSHTGDGAEHHKTHRARHGHIGGDSGAGQHSDSGNTHHQTAERAAHKMSRQAWKPDDEHDKKARRPAADSPSTIAHGADRADARRPSDAAHPATTIAAKKPELDHSKSVTELVHSGKMRAVGDAAKQLNAPVAAHVEAKGLDGKTIQPKHQLAGDGGIVQAAQPASGDGKGIQIAQAARPGDARVAPAGDQTRVGDANVRDAAKNPVKDIEVRYSGTPQLIGDPPRQSPDFRVRRDGSVEVLKNPDGHTGDKLVVEVERAPGAAGRQPPPPEQQKAVDQLVGYLSNRYMKQDVRPDGTIQRAGQINDEQGLVTDSAKRAARTQPAGADQLPSQVRDQVQHINRHGGRGTFTPREASEDFAPRTVPRQRGETDKVAALKDVASGFLGRDERDPYHHVQTWPEQGHRVGRYAVSAKNYRDWLSSLSQEEIDKLIKEGKLPKGAAELQKAMKEGGDLSQLTGDAKSLNDFLNKMQSGQGQLSNQEIDRFMGKDLQERMGTDLVKSYALQTADRDSQGRPAAVNVGKVALSMILGHAVTDAEAEQPQNKAIVDAAYKQYALAVQHEQNGNAAIDMSNAAGKIAAVGRADLGRALWAGDLPNGNLGCASSVSRVLREAGVANVREMSVIGLSGKLRGLGYSAHSFEDRRPGDVIIVDGGPRHGHTGVVGETRDITYNNHSGSGRWSADGADYWYRRARGQRLYVLRAPGTA